MTEHHWTAVGALVHRWPGEPRSIAVIGFHGHTLWHRPHEHRTCQIGDGALLARRRGGAGGQRLPLRRHGGGRGGGAVRAALPPRPGRGRGLEFPLAVLNIGGVANVTWIGPADMALEQRVMAFDTGPGGALLDDWALAKTGIPCDVDGRLAARGTVDEGALAAVLADPYFARTPPKAGRQRGSTGSRSAWPSTGFRPRTARRP